MLTKGLKFDIVGATIVLMLWGIILKSSKGLSQKILDRLSHNFRIFFLEKRPRLGANFKKLAGGQSMGKLFPATFRR